MRSGLRSVVRVSVAAVLGLLVLPAGAALAHTDLESTDPADGSVVAGPVSEIGVVFTQPVELVGAGFEVLLPDGDVITPSVTTDDGATFALVLPEPAIERETALRYEVRAADGHILTGGVSFTIEGAPASSDTTAAPASAADDAAAEVVAPAEPEVVSAAVVEDDGGGSGNVVIALAAAVALGAGAFLAVRSRSNRPA